MSQPESLSLTDLLKAGAGVGRAIGMMGASLALDDFSNATSLGGYFDALEGRSIVLMAGDQLKTAAALIELDGWARRIVLCPPDLESKHWGAVIRDAEADAIVYGGDDPPPQGVDVAILAPCVLPLQPRAASTVRRFATEWVLLTSGTTGDPKMVVHTLATLTGAITRSAPQALVQNWATFYDIRRYGGLQIFLRAIAGRGSLTLRNAGETVDDFLIRAGVAGVTHISGTPSHWRLVLMNAAARRMDPEYVRLSGEIADSSVLNALAALYPRARVAHAFASTEAGVGFEVEDGQAGFPAAYLGERDNGAALKVVDGSLAIRSGRTALRYLGQSAPILRDAESFVDTGDMIELRGDRGYFVGRRGGIINVGGAKVNPEEVEAVINMHAGVHASLVKARRNPITGALVAADVVLNEGVIEAPGLKDEIIAACARQLAPYKVPALVRFVPTLAVTPSGKLARNG
ncbi:AMP-binding protein [Methylocapsa sp. S129]|uniref:AMP-binding enzyme n=1 Tax=Methylocapsa sp. S129 TaxID=1641869 RepID=UPI00131CD973|nr:AMP-binding protein [Methylocapsa sp. S129]